MWGSALDFPPGGPDTVVMRPSVMLLGGCPAVWVVQGDAGGLLADAVPDVLVYTAFAKDTWRKVWINESFDFNLYQLPATVGRGTTRATTTSTAS